MRDSTDGCLCLLIIIVIVTSIMCLWISIGFACIHDFAADRRSIASQRFESEECFITIVCLEGIRFVSDIGCPFECHRSWCCIGFVIYFYFVCIEGSVSISFDSDFIFFLCSDTGDICDCLIETRIITVSEDLCFASCHGSDIKFIVLDKIALSSVVLGDDGDVLIHSRRIDTSDDTKHTTCSICGSGDAITYLITIDDTIFDLSDICIGIGRDIAIGYFSSCDKI